MFSMSFTSVSIFNHVFQQHTIVRWRIAFWITIVSQVLAFLVFAVFGSAKIQPWNYPVPDDENWDDEGQAQRDQEQRQQETKT